MDKKYFDKIFEEFIKTTDTFYYEKLMWLLYKKPFVSCNYLNSEDKKSTYYNWDYQCNIGDIKLISYKKTYLSILQNLKETSVFYTDSDSIYIFGKDYVIYYYMGGDTYPCFYNETGVVPEWFMKLLVFKKEDDPKVSILSGFTQNGISLIESNIKTIVFNSDNYNDDIPTDKINNFLEKEDTSGLIILHGDPGNGKSYYIRSLINTHKDKNWVYIDSADFETLCHNKQYLLSLKNSILVVEDCESLLESRKNCYNSYITDLLNITDGLMGDGLSIKIICTFNTNLVNIDPALLRRGRIKINYEFASLKENKIKNLCNKLNIEYNEKYKSLCDIYNYSEEDYKTKQTSKYNKIGF